MLRKTLIVLAALVLVALVAHVSLGLVVGSRLRATVEDLEERWGSLDPSTLAPPGVEPRDNRARPLRAPCRGVSNLVILRPGGNRASTRPVTKGESR